MMTGVVAGCPVDVKRHFVWKICTRGRFIKGNKYGEIKKTCHKQNQNI